MWGLFSFLQCVESTGLRLSRAIKWIGLTTLKTYQVHKITSWRLAHILRQLPLMGVQLPFQHVRHSSGGRAAQALHQRAPGVWDLVLPGLSAQLERRFHHLVNPTGADRVAAAFVPPKGGCRQLTG